MKKHMWIWTCSLVSCELGLEILKWSQVVSRIHHSAIAWTISWSRLDTLGCWHSCLPWWSGCFSLAFSWTLWEGDGEREREIGQNGASTFNHRIWWWDNFNRPPLDFNIFHVKNTMGFAARPPRQSRDKISNGNWSGWSWEAETSCQRCF